MASLEHLLLLIIISYVAASDLEVFGSLHNRHKRQLIFPNSTLLQFNAGVGMPAIAEHMNINYAFQANFQLPWNRTQIPFDILLANSGFDGDARRKRDTSLQGTNGGYQDDAKLYHFYKHVESVLDGYLISLQIFGLLIFTASGNNEEEHKAMVKRQINSLPLVYPYGGTYKFIIAFSAPIKSEDYVNLAFAVNFQYQYVQFANITELSQYYFVKTVSRAEREADILARRDERLTFYRAVSDMLRSKGMEGEDCVLRAICEGAQYPVEEEGLIGEIVHILLTPDYGKSPFDENKDEFWESMIAPYKDAATAGRQMFDCASIYTGCPEGAGLMELFTVLRDE